jgi:hypothetical protein
MRRRSAALSRLAALLACAAGLLCATAAPAAAGTSYVDGVSDQNLGLWAGNYLDASGFTTPFTSFFASSWVGATPSHILYARFVTAPDTVAQGGACMQNLADWYTRVTQLHLIPVIAVWQVAEGGCADNGVPSTSVYAGEIAQLLGYLDSLGPSPLPYLEAWNEPNASGVGAVQAADYWTAADAACASAGCTALAGDLVDSPDQASYYNPGCPANLTYANMAGYEDRYVTELGGARPAIWAFHPYSAVNCEQTTSVTTFDAHLPTPIGATWFTEAGAWECRLGQTNPRGIAQQDQDASFLVNTLMSPTSPTAPAHVFWYELAAVGYTQDCHKYADSALYEANTSPGPLLARPAALTIFGPDSSLAAATGAAHGVTSTQATFTGAVTPAGIEGSSYSFEYGPTAAYGLQTAPVAVDPGLAPAAASSAVTGLTPGLPYHYQLVITDSSGLSRSGGDVVMPPVVIGSAAPTAAASAPLTATWSGVSDPGASDWIGLYPAGSATAAPLGGIYANSCATLSNGGAPAAGACTLTAPAVSGSYELRLYASPGGTLLATSGAISVPSLRANAIKVVFGTPLSVAWSGVADADANDWIGVYRPGALDGAPVAGVYAGSCGTTTGAAASPAGSCAFTLPHVTGGYELRLFRSPRSGLLATSATVSSVPPVPVDLSPPRVTGAHAPTRVLSGVRVTCTTGAWSNAPTGYTYRWLRDGAPIGGQAAAGASYVPSAADAGHTLRCTVTASNAGGPGRRAVSSALLVHSAPPGTVFDRETVDRAGDTVRVRFHATGVASGFHCALLRADGPGTPTFRPCRSPLVLRGLAAGRYILEMRAFGPGGADATPARYRFTAPAREPGARTQ